MASISALSTELLYVIFWAGSQDDPNFPLTISLVCSLWRELAHTSSDLWTNVVLKNHFSARFQNYTKPRHLLTDESRSLQKARHYFKLSGARPIDVEVSLPMPPRDARKDEGDWVTDFGYDSRTEQIVSLILPYFDRIRTLKVSAESYSILTAFFDAMKPLPTGLLRNCEIEWTGPLWAVNNFPQLLQQSHAIHLLDKSGDLNVLFPRLRCLRLSGVSVDWSNFSPSNLEELHISNVHERFKPSFQVLRSILSANQKSLQRLDLLEVGRRADMGLPALSFELPHVHTLILGYYDPEDLFALVSSMFLPELKTLVVNNMRRRQDGKANKLPPPGLTDYFAQTDELFKKFTVIWDFSKLEYIELIDVEFMDDAVHLPDPAEYPDFLAGSESTDERRTQMSQAQLPLKFWSSCTNVKEVVVERPDVATLFSLNCPATSKDVDEMANFELPLPKLAKFGMFGVWPWMVEEFFQQRQNVVTKWLEPVSPPVSLDLTTDCRGPLSIEGLGDVLHTLRYAKANRFYG